MNIINISMNFINERLYQSLKRKVYKNNTDRRGRILAGKQTYGDPYTLNSRNISKSSGIDGEFKEITDNYSARLIIMINYRTRYEYLHAVVNYSNENYPYGMFASILTT